MNAGTYKGVVRSFDVNTKQATIVVPQLFDMKPIVCDPFVANEVEKSLIMPLAPGDQVMVIWDGGQSNALPQWLPSQSYAELSHWNSAWGVVASTSNNVATSYTTTPATLASVGFTAVAGRRYAASWQAVGDDSASATTMHQQLKIDNTVLASLRRQMNVASEQQTWIIVCDSFTTTPGFHTVSAVWQFPGGTTLNLHGDWEPWTLTVQDVGPISQAAIPATSTYPRIVSDGNALGVVYRADLITTGSDTVVNGTPKIITNPLTFTPQVGRRYRMHFIVRAMTSSPSAAQWIVTPFMDGINAYAQMGDRYIQIPGPGVGYVQCNTYWMFDGDGVSHTYNVQVNTSIAGQTVTWLGNGGHFYMEDVGPNSYPALPIPTTTSLPWTSVTFENAWVNVGVEQTCQYRKIGDMVSLRGTMRNGTYGTTAFTLPTGFRPPAGLRPNLMSINSVGTQSLSRADILADGRYIPQSGAPTSGGYLAIDYSFSTTA